MAPCIVLYVDDPAVLLEAVVFNRGAALLIPQPLVVTGDNRQAEVLLRSAEMPAEAIPETVRDPLIGVQMRMTRAIESIAERQGAAPGHQFLNSESPQRRLLGDLRTPSREIASRTLCPVASVLFYADHKIEAQNTADFSAVTEKIATNRTLRGLAIGSALLVAGLINGLTRGAWAVAYAIPVALAAVLDRWRGGLLLSALSAAAVFAFSPDQSITTRCLECLALLLLACLTAAAAGRERRLLHHYRKVADQLSGVYEKVQANFEGMKRVERLSATRTAFGGTGPRNSQSAREHLRRGRRFCAGPSTSIRRARMSRDHHERMRAAERAADEFSELRRPRPPRLQTSQLEPVLDNVLDARQSWRTR